VISLTISTTHQTGTTDITDRVARNVQVDDGLCHVSAAHTTCAITVTEDTDGSVATDIHEKLSDLIPTSDNYKHDRIDGNADAHIKASLIGHDTTLPVVDGSLALGAWQRILLVEFDGGRQRTVRVTTLDG
jgi:secondary thiamine-phosphate synthase enzyme